MASTMRSVDTRFWSDVWVRKLNALDRYVFLYCLTNEHSSWCGVYELDITMMAFETGIDEHDLKKSILPRLRPKVMYIDGWVYIKNFEKYHNNNSSKTMKGISEAWEEVPQKIKDQIRALGNEIPKMEYKPLPSEVLPRRYVLLVRDRFLCQYCGKLITDDHDYEMDHIIPASNGGNDGYENMVVACRNCNQSKGDLPVFEFCGREIKGKPYHTEKALKVLENDQNMANLLRQVYPSYMPLKNERGISPSASASASASALASKTHKQPSAASEDEKKTNPDVKLFGDFFYKASKEIQGITPIIDWGKCGSLMKRRFENDGITRERLEPLAIWYLSQKKKYQDTKGNWHDKYKNTPDLGVFLSSAIMNSLLSDELNAITYLQDNLTWADRIYQTCIAVKTPSVTSIGDILKMRLSAISKN